MAAEGNDSACCGGRTGNGRVEIPPVPENIRKIKESIRIRRWPSGRWRCAESLAAHSDFINYIQSYCLKVSLNKKTIRLPLWIKLLFDIAKNMRIHV